MRATLAPFYDLPFFKNSNWLMKNIVGNWQFSPIYTFQSPEYATVQSAADANLNGDSAPDRAVFNASGHSGNRVHGHSVDELARGHGRLSGEQLRMRSTSRLVPAPWQRLVATPWDADDQQLGLRDHEAGEHHRASGAEFKFQARTSSTTHSTCQVYISDVESFGQASDTIRNALITGSPTFNQWADVFTNHPRQIVLVLKYQF